MPYGIFGSTQHDSRGKSGDVSPAESEQYSDVATESQGGKQSDATESQGGNQQDNNSVSQGAGKGEYAMDGIDGVVGIMVKDLSRNVIYASGNGVVIDNAGEELCIVTAGHVLERTGADGHVLVSFWTQENWTGAAAYTLECDRYERIQDADLAFLFLSKEQLGAVDIEEREVQVVPVAPKQVYDDLQAGDAVRTIAWDEEQRVIYEGALLENWIYVEDFSQYMMVADCFMRPGMSGCGLYNDTGELLGVACGGNDAGQLVAVPLHVVEAYRR